MADPRDRAHLEKALDEGVHLTLLALADWHREQGDEWAAAGYAELARRRRHPDWRDDDGFAAGGYWVWKHAGTVAYYRSALPGRVDGYLKQLERENGMLWNTSRTLSGAFRRAALAWGLLLKAEAEGETTRFVRVASSPHEGPRDAICRRCRNDYGVLPDNGLCWRCAQERA